MEDSYLTQTWVFEMQEGENISLLCWMIFICIPSEISWEMGYPLLRRCFMRECIAGFCTGLARGGKRPCWPVPVESGASLARIGGQNLWLELVAKIRGQNWWLELVARIGGQNWWP